MAEIAPLWMHLTFVILDLYCVGYGPAYMIAYASSRPSPGGKVWEVVYYIALAILILTQVAIWYFPTPLSPYVP